MLNTLPYSVFNLVLGFTNIFNLKIVNKYCKENINYFNIGKIINMLSFKIYFY